MQASMHNRELTLNQGRSRTCVTDNHLILMHVCYILGIDHDSRALKKLLEFQESALSDNNALAALLVVGGVVLGVHYAIMHIGVPTTIALGLPVSGKTKAVEAAMSILGGTEGVGGKIASHST